MVTPEEEVNDVAGQLQPASEIVNEWAEANTLHDFPNLNVFPEELSEGEAATAACLAGRRRCCRGWSF